MFTVLRRLRRPQTHEPELARASGGNVIGVILMIAAMVLVVPVAIMFGGAIWSALFGWISSDDADRRASAPEEPAG